MPVMRSQTYPSDESSSRPALALLGVFRHRNFRLFFAGQLVSLMGTWMQTVAQAWLVYSLTHSPLFLGLTAFASQVTVFFLAPFGGMVADRVDRRRLLLLTQAASMVQALVLAALTLTGVVKVWEIVALAFGLGLINAFDMPTRQAMLLDMVGPEDLRHAIATNSIMFNLARIVGPSLAGAVIALTGEGWCFGLNALSFAAVLASLILMRLAPQPSRRHQHPLREIADGYRYSLKHRQIRVSLLLIAASSCFGAAYISLLPAFAKDMLHGSAASYGWLMAAAGVGAVIGAYLLSLITERWLALAPVISGAAFSVGVMVFAESQLLWQAMLVLVPTAMFLMVLGGTTNTIIQTAASVEYRGRVISHYSQCFVGMMPWGSLILGALADRFGVRESILWGGSVVLAASTIAWLMRRGEEWKFEKLKVRR
jgi:MFS family permease